MSTDHDNANLSIAVNIARIRNRFYFNLIGAKHNERYFLVAENWCKCLDAGGCVLACENFLPSNLLIKNIKLLNFRSAFTQTQTHTYHFILIRNIQWVKWNSGSNNRIATDPKDNNRFFEKKKKHPSTKCEKRIN